MKLIACCKAVHDEQDITTRPDRTLATDNAGLKISLYDLNAVETAVEIASTLGDSTVTALSVGTSAMVENAKIKKDILSRGPDALTLVADDACSALYSTDTANIIAQAAQKVGFDLLVFGEGSGDLYAQQTGLAVGEYLGLPCVNAVNKITVEGDKIIVERDLENITEELELTLPAVVCVTSSINTPKLPSMKAILAANKKPVEKLGLGDIGVDISALTVVQTQVCAPEQTDRLGIILEGDSDENIATFAEHLRQAVNQ